MALLFVGRVIQGVAGPTVPVCLIMLRVAVPDPKRYGTLLGVITAVNGGIAGVDALAGGWLAQNFGFGSVFLDYGCNRRVGGGGSGLPDRRNPWCPATTAWTGPALLPWWWR